MPAVVRRRGSLWVVLSHAGKGGRVLGKHSTRKAAQAQQRAVNRSLKRRGKI